MKVGDMVKWIGDGGRSSILTRINRGIKPGDVGIVLEILEASHLPVEIYVMIKEHFEYFQVGEVEKL